MSRTILVIGASGSGKSSSMRTVDPNTTFLFNTATKDLPFKGARRMFTPYNKETKKGNMISRLSNPTLLCESIKFLAKERPDIKLIVIDDFQYVIGFENFNRALEKSYDKFTEMAQAYWRIIDTAQNIDRNDLTFVFLSHSEYETKNGIQIEKVKTIGKMLDSQMVVEGLFTCVLLTRCEVDNKKINHYFITNNIGDSTAKSPDGMFDYRIPNDLNYVIDRYNKYFEE